MPKAQPARQVGAIEITDEMIRAGENVLEDACERAGLAPSATVIMAAAQVYIAMVRAKSSFSRLEEASGDPYDQSEDEV